jgi:cytochrome P450
VSLAETVMRRAVEPAVLRYCQWRGDPVARWMGPRAKADPYPLYESVRARGLVRSKLGPWVTASHATASAILRDRRFSSSPAHQRGYRPPAYPPGDPRAGLPDDDLLTLDPPDHTRLRRLVSGAFTPKAIAALEPFIRDATGRLLDSAGPAGFDLIEALAFPLPIAVICHLLGVPAEDQASFRAWGHDVAATLEPQTARAAASQSRTSEQALAAYLRDLAAKRRAEPDGSLLSALTTAEEEGDRLTPGELVSMALLLLVAGFETTVNLIGNGTVALLSESGRGQWRSLADDPALIPGAVEELLRYDSPVQMTSRIATEDADVGGTVIRQGTPVIVAIGGANRDPEVFSQPGRLQVSRPDAARHLSFSLGIHHGLGAPLARLEGRVALEELTRRHPGLELAGTPVRRPLLVLRGFESVPVRPASRRGA